MSKTMKDPRQIGLRKFLTQIGNRAHHEGTADAKPANVSELDNLLDSIDFELTQPLRLDASNPADLVINVGPAIITNTENNRNRSIPHVGSLLPNDFASGTVTFPATSGNPIVVSPGNNGTLTVPNNEYIKVLLYMDANGDLNVLPGTPNAVEADATVLPTPNNTLPIGYVVLFNNAGTIDSIAQTSIYQFGTGAGGGSGTGDANSFIEGVRNRRDDSIFNAFTAYIAETDQDDDTIIDPVSTGDFNLVTSRYELDTGQQVTTQQLLDDYFLNNNTDLDKAELIVKWDEEAIDTAATYELSKDGGSNWETVTMEQVPDSDTFRGIVQFSPLTGPSQTLDSQTTTDSELELNDSGQQSLANQITLANDATVTEVDLDITVSPGDPGGNPYSLNFGTSQTTAFAENIGINDVHAQSFTPAEFIDVDQIIMYSICRSGPGVTGTVRIVVYEDNAGEPGAILGTSNNVDIALSIPVVNPGAPFGGIGVFPFSPGVTLDANTKYWYGVDIVSISSGALQIYRAGNVIVGESSTISNDNGSTWASPSTSDFPSRIDGTTIPLSPAGNLTVSVYSDNAGLPDSLVASATPVDISILTTGTQTFAFSQPLIAGDYHIVAETDTTYKNKFVTNVTSIKIDANSAGTEGVSFDGATWSASGSDLVFEVRGILTVDLDLRARITSSQDDRLVEGIAVLFEQGPGDTSLNLDESYINSIIIEENRLGSTNPLYDRSVAGEGILLRATNGTLVEASIEWNGFNYQWNFAEVPE